MVKLNDIYMVMSTVAVLHDVPTPKTLEVKLFEQLLSPPISVTSSTAGMLISSQRDQIEVLVENNKTDFRDLSGRKDFSSNKLAEVIEYFVSQFGLKPNTYGINFILRIPHIESKKWIMGNILSSGISEKTKKELVGGSGTVSMKSGRKIWNVVFESADNDKIMVNFNATEKTSKLPSVEPLLNDMKKQWNSLVKFINALGL